MGIRYASREDVRNAVDLAETARNDRALDRAIEAASRDADRIANRTEGGFWPEVMTRRYDWPAPLSMPTPWRVWLGEPELVTLTSMTSGGIAVDVADVITYPDTGPPYDRLELDRSTTAELGLGDTPQNDVTITGVWGYRIETEAVGALEAAVASTSTTTIDVTDGTIGVGDLLTIDDERVVVTGRAALDTGQTLGGSGLTASSASVSAAVSDGTAFTVGEELAVESERLLVTDVVGNTVTVKRAVSGSVLAAHANGVAVYSRRRLTVERGALGTTAATHSDATAIVRQVWPGPLRRFVVGAAAAGLVAEGAALASQAGTGERAQDVTGTGLDALAEALARALGRRVRAGAV